MEINGTNPVANQAQGLETAQKISPVKREKEATPDQQATQTKDSPDDRISLSDESKKAVAELTPAPAAGQATATSELSETEASRLAQQVSEQLAQTNTAIANQAIQKAVDLFI